MESENTIILITFIVTVVSFYFQYFKYGKIYVHRPNTLFLYIISDFFFIAFPLIVENTGIAVHTIDFISGRIRKLKGKRANEFVISKILSEPNPIKEESSAHFTSFGVSSRSSKTKIISIKSKKEISLTMGEYILQLNLDLDNSELLTIKDFLHFKIDKKSLKSLNEGKYLFLGNYATIEPVKMKKKTKKRMRNIQIGLISLLIILAVLAILSSYIQVLSTLMIGSNFSFLALILVIIAIVFFILIWVKPVTEEIKRKEHKISILRNIESDLEGGN